MQLWSYGFTDGQLTRNESPRSHWSRAFQQSQIIFNICDNAKITPKATSSYAARLLDVCLCSSSHSCTISLARMVGDLPSASAIAVNNSLSSSVILIVIVALTGASDRHFPDSSLCIPRTPRKHILIVHPQESFKINTGVPCVRRVRGVHSIHGGGTPPGTGCPTLLG